MWKISKRYIKTQRLWIQVKNEARQSETLPNQLVNLYDPLIHKTPLTWYSCGPTVYDSAHLGHARTYVCTDILRRIISNHFQIPLHYAMGITDIDDKIIKKGKQLGYSNNSSDYLQLAKNYENEFFSDMDKLNILRPDAILKVSNYINEIFEFIQVLIDKGYAYSTQQGIYFRMSRLSPEKYDVFGVVPTSLESRLDAPELPTSSEAANEDYDGNLTTKADIRDFALWKTVAESEPGWSSPWGWGRPGWHIECSTMTYSYFGKHLDIHSGGVDLKFPHHTNEIVQSECHHNHINESSSWVRLWIHTGHLHIVGRKMSKSLKNFISISQYLTEGITLSPSDDFRIFCLQYHYSSTLTYSKDRIIESSIYRKKLESFFQLSIHLLSHHIKQHQTPSSFSSSNTTDTLNTTPLVGADIISHPLQNQKPSEQSKQLLINFNIIKEKINDALKNDFDTSTVLQLISDLVGQTSEYMKYFTTDSDATSLEGVKRSNQHPIEPIYVIAHYLRNLGAYSFGLQFCENTIIPSLSLDKSDVTNNSFTSNEGGGRGGDYPSSTKTSVDLALQFRSKVKATVIERMKAIKQQLKQKDLTSEQKEVLVKEMNQWVEMMKSSDELRSGLKEKLDITVLDLPNGDSTWSKSS